MSTLSRIRFAVSIPTYDSSGQPEERELLLSLSLQLETADDACGEYQLTLVEANGEPVPPPPGPGPMMDNPNPGG